MSATFRRIRQKTDPTDATFWGWQAALRLRLLSIIREKNLSQKHFAQLVGLTEGQLSNLINEDCNPSLKTLARIQAKAQVELFQWMSGDETISMLEDEHDPYPNEQGFDWTKDALQLDDSPSRQELPYMYPGESPYSIFIPEEENPCSTSETDSRPRLAA